MQVNFIKIKFKKKNKIISNKKYMENINVFLRLKPSNIEDKIFYLPESTNPFSQDQIFNKKTNEYYSFGKKIIL